jgi:hypothetical protein
MTRSSNGTRRVLARCGSLVLLVALAGCPEAKAPPPAPASSPAAPAAAPEKPAAPEGALDPMYDPLRPGEVYVVKMDFGTPLSSRAEVKSKDPEKVVIETRTEMGGVKAEPQVTEIRRHRGPLDEKLAAGQPPETLLRRETLTISGIAFDCRVVESEDKVMGKVTSWKCDSRYPGTVKQVDASGKIVLELVEVQPPK